MAELRNGYSLNPRALWVGEVPDVWEFFKGKYVFGERFEKGNEKNLELLSPTQKYGVIPQSMYDKLSGMRAVKVKESTDLALFKTVHTGDFCISLRSFQGGFEYSRYEGVVSPAYHILFPKKNIVDGYYKYLFKETSFIAEMNSYCQSLRDGKNISYEDFGKTVIPYPPLDEQRAIADYLDNRCSKIDEIIAEATTSIEEYKELKQAVIDNVITCGLNPDRNVIQSGSKWVSRVPVGWRKVKLGWICSFHNGDRSNRYPSGDDFVNEGIPFAGADSLNGTFVDIEKCRFIRCEHYKSLSGLKIQKNDILYTLRGSTIGKCAIADFDNGTVASSLTGIRVERTDDVNPMFLLYWLQSICEYNQRTALINGSTAPNLSAENVRQYKIFLPSMNEQDEIVEYLNEVIKKYDDIIKEKQDTAQLLIEYKKSLIYEVVTGKKRVIL